MFRFFRRDDRIDPLVSQQLHHLRQFPPRDPETARTGRERFMAQLDQVFPETPAAKQPRPGRWQPLFRLQEDNPMKPQSRFAFTTLTAVITVLVFLFGGVGVTVLAAQSSLPGDGLFTIRTSLEHTQAALEPSPAGQAKLHLQFANQRLEDMQALVAGQRFNDLPAAAQAFEAEINHATDALQRASGSGTTGSGQIENEIHASQDRLTQLVAGLPAQAPASLRAKLEDTVHKDSSSHTGEQQVESEHANEARPDNPAENQPEHSSTTLPGKGSEVESEHGFEVESQPGNSSLSNDDHSSDHPASSQPEENPGHDQNSAGQPAEDSTFSLIGVVQVISPDQWIIDGQVIQVDASTSIEGTFSSGSVVEVHLVKTADGKITAQRIERARPDNRSNSNSGSGGNGGSGGSNGGGGNDGGGGNSGGGGNGHNDGPNHP